MQRGENDGVHARGGGEEEEDVHLSANQLGCEDENVPGLSVSSSKHW